jgi:hypothetical protein
MKEPGRVVIPGSSSRGWAAWTSNDVRRRVAAGEVVVDFEFPPALNFARHAAPEPPTRVSSPRAVVEHGAEEAGVHRPRVL